MTCGCLRLKRFWIALATALLALHVATGCAASNKQAASPGGAPPSQAAYAEQPSAPPAPTMGAAAPTPAAPAQGGSIGSEASDTQVVPAAVSPTNAAATGATAAPKPGAQQPAHVATAPPKAAVATATWATSKAAPAPGQPAAPAPATLIIYQGEMQRRVEEKQSPATLDRIIDIAESIGGYLGDRKDASVQVRVPSSRFRETLQQIEKLGDVMHRSVSANDVSEQYNDLEVKLQNLKATQKRLHEFLARAAAMQDMLSVNKELERVSAEIDAIEGKMRYLKSRAAFSTINVSVQPKPTTQIALEKQTPAPPAPPRELELSLEWLNRIGIGTLLNLH